MPSTQQSRPVVTLLPSSQEKVKAYMAAIRLASSVRNKMDAEKAGAAGDKEKVAVNADSDGCHDPNYPPSSPPPADAATHGEHKPVPILNQTSSALSNSNTTKPGFVRPRDSHPSSGHWMDTAKVRTGATVEALKQPHGHLPPPKFSIGTGTVLENAAADTPTSVELDALEQHQGHFPPPEPPIGSTPAPPGEVISRRTGPLPVDLNQDPLPYKWNASGGISPQCKLYVTNTDVNVTFIACPATKTTDNNKNSTHDLASRELDSGNESSSHILAIRNTAMCEAPASFNQRVACGNYDGWFVLGFFILFAMIVSAWIKVRRQHTTQRLDDEENENGNTAQLRLSHASSTNAAEAKLREKIRKGNKEEHGMDEKLSTEQYGPVAWRSAAYRAARATIEGKVSHDAVPIAELPKLSL